MNKTGESLNSKRLKRKNMQKRVRFFQLFIISIFIFIVGIYLELNAFFVIIGLGIAIIILYFLEDIEKLFLM